MQLPRTVVLVAVLATSVHSADAQTLASGGDETSQDRGQLPAPRPLLDDDQGRPGWLTPDRIDLSPRAQTPNPFKSFGGDMKQFFSGDNIRFLGLASVFAIAVTPWDSEGIAESQEHWAPSPGTFKPGNIGGSFFAQMGAGAATWGIGKATGSAKATAVGADLLRGQMVSQVVVQGIKLVTQRPRPDGSNNHSFPSGHTASAFATATVIERHFGWKAGVPAYAFAAYVGASRMSANKHHLSDVMMGAAVGIAAGRVVTVGIGDAKFNLGVAPTQGGAAVMFTKK